MLATERFDLILLDVEMPELDGVAMLKQLAAERRLVETPVIMTSALDEVERIAECIGLGADDFLSKPVNPVLLKARVSSSLAKKRWHDEQRLLMRRFATEEVVDDLARSGSRSVDPASRPASFATSADSRRCASPSPRTTRSNC